MQTILCDLKECPMCQDGTFCTCTTLSLKNGVCSNIYKVQNGKITPNTIQHFGDCLRSPVTVLNVEKREESN